MATAQSPYWLGELERQGLSPHHPSGPAYKVFRNVRDYGAKGDGVTDDTAAINLAIRDGQRCGEGHAGNDSSTVSPALVYFPSGTYRITAPIISYYYTSLVGDATSRPVLKADACFRGLALIDENPYLPGGRNWYTNQNNFFRSVAHLVVDLTAVSPHEECAGIHHQVAQATTLRHVHFELPLGPNRCRGIFMENGSGGHLTSLTFRGGHLGAWLGNQQFTVQDCTFEKCHRAIYQDWCWSFVYHRVKVRNCHTALQMRAAVADGRQEQEQGASSAACLDWDVRDTHIVFDIISQEVGARGSLVISNLKSVNVDSILVRTVKDRCMVMLAPVDAAATTTDWIWQGDAPPPNANDPATGPLKLPRPTAMLDDKGHWHAQPRPEYLDVPASNFISARNYGAVGDGVHDDTQPLQMLLRDLAGTGKVLWIPHGNYLITDTLVIPPGSRIVGEVWPVLLGTGPSFQDAANPRPVIQVGEPEAQEGSSSEGLVEISELIFSTKGPCPGAIVLRWSLRGGPESGLWDTHIRLGGCAGTDLDDERFDRENSIDTVNAQACFMAWHLTRSASGCFINNWVWLADHLLDSTPGRDAGKQLSLLAARGIFIESNPGPVWLWGGASEHFLLYQYQLVKAQNVFIGHAQTESPYFLGEGVALPGELAQPVTTTAPWYDPEWRSEDGSSSHDPFHARSWGIRIVDSWSVHLHGPGLYSFFDAYSQDRLGERRCQRAMLSVEQSRGQDVVVVNLNTIGARSMVDVEGQEKVNEENHRNGFVSTLGYAVY